jgi:hypothetical protein
LKEENEFRRSVGAFESKELSDVLGDKITFKQFAETYHLGFFEKKRFEKFINTLGLGWYDAVSWRVTTWEMYYLKFKRERI